MFDKIRKWYDDLDRKAQKTAKIIAGFVALVLLAFLVSMCSAPAQGAIAVEKATGRVAPTSASASLLEPVYACSVSDDAEGDIADVKLPARPQVGDVINDQRLRPRTIASVTVFWSEGIAASQYQPARIACEVKLDPV